MRDHLHILWIVTAFIMFGLTARAHADTLPPGFIQEEFGGVWNEAVGITFAEDGTLFGWERRGMVFMWRNNQWSVAVDIREEVGGWRDFGLLGVALHPNFLNNGHIYLLYVVDRHHLLHFGTPQYNPNSSHYFAATIGRITRYTLDVNNGFQTVVPNSRLVLVGETVNTGFPVLHESHGVGSLVFGADGALLASCGDGASYINTDMGGSQGGSYAPQALIDGIIQPKENVGAFRAQLVDSLSGKIIRIDPNTGDGLPSNPFFNPAQPRAAKSRVWALGLRNPCRMTLRPGTGSHVAADANPGALYIGDVGMDNWEELSICTAPGQNFGWPIYEGLSFHTGYGNANIANLDAPNPLFGQGGCAQQYFYFRNLMIQDTLNPNPSFPNPCNASVQIPSSIPHFVHRRPEIDWGHFIGPARTGIFSGGVATNINIGAPGSPITGPQFAGNASIGGVWYTGTQFPAQYQNTYFHGEYGGHWIKSISFDANNEAIAVQNFLGGRGELIQLAMDPTNGDLYYARWERVFKVKYVGSGNQPPVAVASANVYYGPSPLTVQFSSAGSSDPETQPLQYLWNFGDGQTSNQANPTHTFTAASGAPTPFNVTLTVTDNGNLTAQATLIVSLNNTPPVVSITSPAEGSTYPITSQTLYWLTASVSDAEHAANQLTCQWQTILHHNDHTHPEPVDTNCSTTSVISPVGCDENIYFYRIKLTVTDAAGLSGSDEVLLYPNCTGNQLPTANDDVATVARGSGGAVQIAVLENDSDADGTLNPAAIAIVQPPDNGIVTVNASTGVLTYAHDGSRGGADQFGYTVNDNAGGTSNLALVSITIEDVIVGDLNDDDLVNVDDLLILLQAWGLCVKQEPCIADIAPQPNGDGVVNVDDLLVLLANWS